MEHREEKDGWIGWAEWKKKEEKEMRVKQRTSKKQYKHKLTATATQRRVKVKILKRYSSVLSFNLCLRKKAKKRNKSSKMSAKEKKMVPQISRQTPEFEVQIKESKGRKGGKK